MFAYLSRRRGHGITAIATEEGGQGGGQGQACVVVIGAEEGDGGEVQRLAGVACLLWWGWWWGVLGWCVGGKGSVRAVGRAACANAEGREGHDSLSLPCTPPPLHTRRHARTLDCSSASAAAASRCRSWAAERLRPERALHPVVVIVIVVVVVVVFWGGFNDDYLAFLEKRKACGRVG